MNARTLCACLSLSLLLTGRKTVIADEPAEKPLEVAVVRPVVKEVTDHEDLTGRLEASTRVELRARATGHLVKVNFQDGAEVKQGEVLFEIDPRFYQAQLDQARAQLNLAQARLALAEKNLARLEAMNRKAPGSVTDQELDQARAAVAEAKARVRAQEASLETSKLNLEFTRITAPINGRIGRRLVDPGNLVKAEETRLAIIVAVDPLHVEFDVDERTFLRLRKLASAGKLKADQLPLAIGLANEEGFPHPSVVSFIDNRVDAQTGTLRMRAVLPNKDGRLLPGLFVRGRMALGEPYRALLIPAQAIQAEEGQNFVLVVNDKNALERRPVDLGPELQGRRVVTRGLKAEDQLVVQGLHRLRPGMVVKPRLVPNEEKSKGGQGERSAAPGVFSSPVTTSAGRGVLVETVYPGASAAVVSEVVRTPIEQQLGGIEKLRMLRSRCTNDGRYVADLSFPRGADLSMMHVLVQNRVAVAEPALPEEVRANGVIFRRGSAGVLLIVNLTSSDGRHDRIYLSKYATLQIKDELSRVAGVSGTTVLGQSDVGLRIWLNPDQLAARNLTADDVMKALREQNVQVAPGRLGQPPVPRGQYQLNTLGRLADPDEVAGIILKSTPEGRVIYLKDVACIEMAAGGPGSLAALDGKPAATLVVALTGEVATRRVRAALKTKLAEIAARLPKGLELDLSFDFTANRESPDDTANPEFLMLDVELPAGVSLERTGEVLSRSAELLRETAGVQHVLALSGNPFDLFGSEPCLLVRLSPSEQRKTGREAMIQAIHKRLGEMAEMRVRVRDLSAPGHFPPWLPKTLPGASGYPVDFALRGPELDQVREWAGKLSERLGGSKKVSDLGVSRASAPQPQRFVEVDRKKAASVGVSVQDIFDTLQTIFGGLQVADFNRFGRTWRVQVQVEGGAREWMKTVRLLKVRNRDGQMVPLTTLVTVREIEAPLALDFLDGLPMLEITANTGSGVTIEEARKFCEAQAEEARKELRLPAQYRLTWLQDVPAAR